MSNMTPVPDIVIWLLAGVMGLIVLIQAIFYLPLALGFMMFVMVALNGFDYNHRIELSKPKKRESK